MCLQNTNLYSSLIISLNLVGQTKKLKRGFWPLATEDASTKKKNSIFWLVVFSTTLILL